MQITNLRTQERVDLRALFMLDPDVIYLNHGSLGARPRAVFETYQALQREYERQPIAFGHQRGQDLDRARHELAVYLGAGADDLVYVVNATFGLNVIARSIHLEPGDEVLSTTQEYGAVERAWQFNCARCGVRYVRQPLPVPVESVEQVVETVWAGVTERTRVLAFSHITSPTAWVLPARELVRRARREGILTVIDGAHAPGQIPLHLADMGVDFYVGNCHKWLMAPGGSAFLYARPEVQDMLEPLVVSWGWGNSEPHVTRFVDEQQNQGTRDLSAFLSVPAALAFMQEHDWDAVRQDCHDLVRYARAEVARLTGLEPLTPDDGRWFSQMSALPLPLCDTARLSQYLHERYCIEIPVIRWDDRCLVRLSVQGYNTAQDVETLIRALHEFLDGSTLDP